MAAPDGATTKMRLSAGFTAATMVCLCLGCRGPGAGMSSSQGRSERLTQLPGLETRRQQSAIARRSTLYREPQREQEAARVGLDMVIKAKYDPYEALEIFEHLREGNATKQRAPRRLYRTFFERSPLTLPCRNSTRRSASSISKRGSRGWRWGSSKAPCPRMHTTTNAYAAI